MAIPLPRGRGKTSRLSVSALNSPDGSASRALRRGRGIDGRVDRRVKQGGPVAIGLGVLTPGVRSAVVPACGLAALPLRIFLPGLALGSAADIALHFALGYLGAELLSSLVQPSPFFIAATLAILGLVAWLVIARRKHLSRAQAIDAWAQATCPVCLVLGSTRHM